MENFLRRLETGLDDRNYQMNPVIREYNHRHIKNIFQRVIVTKAEVDMLHGVLSCLLKEKVDDELILSEPSVNLQVETEASSSSE